MNKSLLLLFVLGLTALIPAVMNAQVTTLRVENKVEAPIDGRIFGAFMEKAPNSEPGPDAAATESGELEEVAFKTLAHYSIPIIRYPGGYHIEAGNFEWTMLIDNAPGRMESQRKMDWNGENYAFGLDQFLHLCEELKSEPLLVVELKDAFVGNKPLDEAADFAAAMVAYCNGTLDSVPEQFRPFVQARIKNGREKPWGVRLWQIGNESFVFIRKTEYAEAEPEVVADRLATQTTAYANAMLAVDPSIQLIADIQIEGKKPGLVKRLKESLGDKIAYMSRHSYKPWGITKVEKDGEDYDPSKLTFEEVWHAYVAPLGCGEDGRVQPWTSGPDEAAEEAGYPVAVTEWNWNGGWWKWSTSKQGPRPPDPLLAKGIGAASWLHSFMRAGERVKIANQSMLIGDSWQIGSIAIFDENGQMRALPRPTGLVTFLYSAHHGEELLATEQEGSPTFAQPVRLSGIFPQEKVAYLDALVTRSGEKLFVHVINRHRTDAQELRLEFADGLLPRRPGIVRYTVTANPLARNIEELPPLDIERAEVDSDALKADGVITVPPHSVSVYVIE